jgi:hypothetical protein
MRPVLFIFALTLVVALCLTGLPFWHQGECSQAYAQQWLEEQQDRSFRPQYKPDRELQKKFFSNFGFGNNNTRSSRRPSRLKRLSDVIPRGLIPGREQRLSPQQAREAAAWQERQRRERGFVPGSPGQTYHNTVSASPSSSGQPAQDYQPAPQAKNSDADVILVIGDEMAVQLAEGLEDYYAQEPSMAVLSRAGEGHDLILPEGTDLQPWQEQMDSLLATPYLQAIIVALGVDDFEPLKREGQDDSLQPGEDNWESAYRGLIRQLALDLTVKGKPVYWMSLMPVEDEEKNRQIGVINTLMEQTVSGTPVRYIDVWSAFADENGGFTRNGPDLNGNETALRWKNGESLTRAGRLKYAHFVARYIRVRDDLLDDRPDLTAGATPRYEGLLPDGKGYGPVIHLSRPASVAGEDQENAKLLLDSDAARPQAPLVRQRLIEGKPLKVPEGRLDAFVWQP